MNFTAMENIINNVQSIKNYGKAVRLDTTRIVNDEDYTLKPNTYKDFINAHWDDILHIEPNQQYKTFVTLKEDTNNPKWLFDMDDLVEIEVLKNGNVKAVKDPRY